MKPVEFDRYLLKFRRGCTFESSRAMIRVILFDDNYDLRESFQAVFKNHHTIEVLGCYSQAQEAPEIVSNLQPDVVIMDINMPGINGIEAVKKIKKVSPDIPILMQTVFEDEQNIFQAITAGASGYILKSSTTARLVQAIEEVHGGGAPFSPGIARKVLGFFQRQLPSQEDYHLQPREMEVIEYLVKGLSYKQIAAKMDITYTTVRFHMKNIYTKLHVASMTEVVAKALQNKWFR